jgi:SAM-dependent methyltransferase
VTVARANGLDVRCGSLEEQGYTSESFDAIHLCHVIEHVPDPQGLLAECARLLRPGGKLVIFTPNISSLSHRIFRQDWRGLEPPRHLQVFSPGAMQKMFDGSAFTSVSVETHVGTSVTAESYALRRKRLRQPDLLGPLFRSRFFWRICSEFQERLLPWIPSMGETLAVVATRQGTLSVAD